MAALLKSDALRQPAPSPAALAECRPAFEAGNRRPVPCWAIGRNGRLTCSWTVEQTGTAIGFG